MTLGEERAVYDFECADHAGTVATITPRSDAARDWLFANASHESLRMVGGCYVIGEPKPMLDIALGMIADGLTCPGSDRLAA